MRAAGVELAIMEVSSHALDQRRIAGLSFDAAALTNVTQDHLDYHKDMEQYFQAKAQLFSNVPHADKKVVINWDDPYSRRLLEEMPHALGFGLGEIPEGMRERALHGTILSSSVEGLELEMRLGTDVWRLHSPLIGGFNALESARRPGCCAGLWPDSRRHEVS